MSAPEVESALIAKLLEALRALPDVTADHARQSDADGQAAANDVSVSMQVAGHPLALLVGIRKALYPRDVRHSLWQIRDAASRRIGEAGAESAVPLLAAESISPGAKELLKAERVGYFDAGGSLYIPAPGALFFVDKPPSKSAFRAIRSLFSGRRAHVLHGLLMRREDWLGVTELAEDVSASPSTVSMVLTELERLDWLDSRGQGPGKQRRVSQPAALLDAWATSLKQQPAEATRRFFVPSMKADALAAGLDGVCSSRAINYAVTHEAAASAMPRFCRTSRRFASVCQPARLLKQRLASWVPDRSMRARIWWSSTPSRQGTCCSGSGWTVSGWPARSRPTWTSCAPLGAPRNWPSTCAGKGSASNGQTFPLRRIQRCLHRGL